MDSVEVTVSHTESETGHEWRLSVETFSDEDVSITGQQFWLGEGESVSDYVVGQVLLAVKNQTFRLVQKELGVHCLDHEIIYCNVCGLDVYERGPFD